MLDLTGNEICGVRSSGTEPFNAYVVRMVCGLIRREGGGLRRLRLKGNHLIGNDIYTNEAVLLLAEALRSPHCVLEELDVSDNGMKAEREPQPPSRLPPKLYGLTRTDGPALAGLVPLVRARVLRALGYPKLFATAAARGFELPPLDAVANSFG